MNNWFRKRRRGIAGTLILVLTCVWSLAFAQPCESHQGTNSRAPQLSMGTHGEMARHGCPHCPTSHHDQSGNNGCPDGQCGMDRVDQVPGTQVESVTGNTQIKAIAYLAVNDEPKTVCTISHSSLARYRHIVEPPPRLKFCTLLI